MILYDMTTTRYQFGSMPVPKFEFDNGWSYNMMTVWWWEDNDMTVIWWQDDEVPICEYGSANVWVWKCLKSKPSLMPLRCLQTPKSAHQKIRSSSSSPPASSSQLLWFASHSLFPSSLVVNTFRRSTAERVPSECSQVRYIGDIFQLLL